MENINNVIISQHILCSPTKIIFIHHTYTLPHFELTVTHLKLKCSVQYISVRVLSTINDN